MYQIKVENELFKLSLSCQDLKPDFHEKTKDLSQEWKEIWNDYSNITDLEALKPIFQKFIDEEPKLIYLNNFEIDILINSYGRPPYGNNSIILYPYGHRDTRELDGMCAIIGILNKYYLYDNVELFPYIYKDMTQLKLTIKDKIKNA